MLPLLFLIPLFASLVLGVVFLLQSDARPATRGLAVAWFAIAAYLQFFSRYALAGLLLQVALALALLIWRRLDGWR